MRPMAVEVTISSAGEVLLDEMDPPKGRVGPASMPVSSTATVTSAPVNFDRSAPTRHDPTADGAGLRRPRRLLDRASSGTGDCDPSSDLRGRHELRFLESSCSSCAVSLSRWIAGCGGSAMGLPEAPVVARTAIRHDCAGPSSAAPVEEDRLNAFHLSRHLSAKSYEPPGVPATWQERGTGVAG